MKLFLTSLFFTLTITSCGDIFQRNKQIIDSYYLVEGDASEVSICLKLPEGNFIGRIPSHVLSYATTDSFLIGKSQPSNKEPVKYYIINMNLDSIYAKGNSFIYSVSNEQDFQKAWQREQLKFIKAGF